MKRKVSALLAALLLPAFAQAEQPNVEPGEWEYTNEITYEGDMVLPDQSHTHTECLTMDDIRQGDAFLEETDDCSVSSMEITRDHMSYSMQCEDEQGMSMNMDARVDFMGTRMSGQMDADLDTPMGPMLMRVTIEGERTGDC